MIFDNLLLTAVVAEMTPLIEGGVVQIIKQPSKDEIFMDIHALGATHTLFFSLNPKFPRFYLSQTKQKALLKAPDFTMIMRKYLEGAFLEKIERIGFDRIVKFVFQSLEKETFYLFCEIMGKHSNLILTDKNKKILGCIKSVGATMSSVRQILIGREYVLPPNVERINPLTCSFTVYESVVNSITATEKDKQIKEVISNFTGISPFLANELFYDIDVTDAKAGFEALQNLKDICENNKFIANLIIDQKGKANNVYPIYLKSVPGDRQLEKTSLNELCDQIARSIINEEIYESTKANLLSQITNAIVYRRKAVKDCEEAISRGKSERNLQIGELLKASMHTFKKGDKVVELVDYYDVNMPTIKVNLDDKLTPAENVEKYFKKHKKQKETGRLAQERMESLINSLSVLENEKIKVQNETRTVNIRQIGENLKALGFLQTPKTQSVNNTNLFGGYNIKRTYSPEGWEILYGESATANDYLTTKLAKPNDIWLHARQITGAHVIIRTTVKTCNNVPNSTLLFAAKIAAKNSDAKHSSMVPVDRTFKKYVRKPKGSVPGFVLYVNEKTIDVVLK